MGKAENAALYLMYCSIASYCKPHIELLIEY